MLDSQKMKGDMPWLREKPRLLNLQREAWQIFPRTNLVYKKLKNQSGENIYTL